MRERNKPPFQARVASVAIITTVAVLVAACLSFMLQQWSVSRQQAHQQQATLASVIAAASAPDIAARDAVAMRADVAAAAVARDMIDVRLVDPRGGTAAYFAAPASPTAQQGPAHTEVAPIVLNARVVGQVVLRAYEPTLLSLLPRFLALTGALFFGASGIALFVAHSLSRRVTAPIERLSKAMAQIASSGEFLKLDPHAADDDVFLRLTNTFNDLLTQIDANHRELCETLEDLMEARDAANAANIAKSQFLANMSHEIRTPLNGVLAMAEVMDRGDLSETQRERLGVVRQSGEQLLAVLNDVLDLSKIEAGKLELAERDFDIEKVAQSVRDAFAAIAEDKGLAFSVDVTPEVAGAWRGDAARLRQILANLVSNAVKFTNEGAVTARFEPADAGGLRLSVTDTGIGIAQGKILTLFEKFTQADSSTTRQYGGTGLGLAICRELAQLMGGQVSVMSQEGVGSTFIVELPFRRGEQVPSAAEDVEPVAEVQRSVRVLAAEDNLVNQKVLKAIVEPMDVELVIVGDGRAALDAWRAGGFDVILMDIQMPVMDGITAAKTIREAERKEQLARTPILALTANALVHQVEEYLAAGMDGHVAKPIEISKLYDAMNRVLSDSDQAAAAA
ncbi:MAG TPA: ATP-binding protein [Caulobacteraceae bacterium]|jgi:signal transduction histidine kinase/ActR/RegA family two-component response regulator